MLNNSTPIIKVIYYSDMLLCSALLPTPITHSYNMRWMKPQPNHLNGCCQCFCKAPICWNFTVSLCWKFTFGQVQFSILCCNNTEIWVWLGLVLKACLFEVRKTSCFVLSFPGSVSTNMAGTVNIGPWLESRVAQQWHPQHDFHLLTWKSACMLCEQYDISCQSLVYRNIQSQPFLISNCVL